MFWLQLRKVFLSIQNIKSWPCNSMLHHTWTRQENICFTQARKSLQLSFHLTTYQSLEKIEDMCKRHYETYKYRSQSQLVESVQKSNFNSFRANHVCSDLNQALTCFYKHSYQLCFLPYAYLANYIKIYFCRYKEMDCGLLSVTLTQKTCGKSSSVCPQ